MRDADGWLKSSYSGGNGNCVEVRKHRSMIAVRDSKNPDGPQLHFTLAEWDAFQRGLADGEFDSLG